MGLGFPRYSLRALFVFCTLAGIACAWVAYQLNWIRQRHEFIRTHELPFYYKGPFTEPQAPWQLRLFGERGEMGMTVPESQMTRAHELFPEAQLNSRPD
jgi:hypothetical protein